MLLSDYQNPAWLKDKLGSSPNSDWYTSVYQYPQEAKDYFDKNGRIRGYIGQALTKVMLFDLDNKDLNKAKDATERLLVKLQSEGVNVAESCRVYFSGSKGFHVELYTIKDFAPTELKPLCKSIIHSIDPSLVEPKKDSKVFDPTVYNITRLIRIPNTKHQTTGLYKIELEPSELPNLTIEQIKEKAKLPVISDFVPTPITDLAFLDKYKQVAYKSTPVSVDIDEDSDIRGLDSIDFEKCPKNMPRCIYALTNGVMQSGIGERNAIFHRLAAYFKNQGYNKELAYNALKGIARLNASLYPEHEPFRKEEIWNTVISSVFADSSNWKSIPGASGVDPNNEMVKRYCTAIEAYSSRKCCLHHKVDNTQTVVQIDGVADNFRNFAENFDKNRVPTGIDFIDQHMNVAVGTTNLLVGCAGSGKTTLALNIIENANAMGLHTMFFSLDMSKNLVYLKLAQKVTSYSQKQILAFYKNKDMTKINEIRKAVADRYGKTSFDFSSTLTLEQMRDKIFAQEQNGNKIKLVVVDYASRISGPHADSYANATYNALKSTEIATVTDTAFIIISQISRNVGDGITPLRTKRAAKDSGSWEESCTNMLTMWRPFLGHPDKDDVIRLYMAKNRMGRELEDIFYFNGEKGHIRDMDLQEKADYEANRLPEEKEYLKARLNKGFSNN